MTGSGNEIEAAEKEEARNVGNNCQFIRGFLENMREKGNDLGAESIKEIEELKSYMKEYVGAKVKFKSEECSETGSKNRESSEEKYSSNGGRKFCSKGDKYDTKFRDRRMVKEENESTEFPH